jgi:predicted ATPase
MAQRLNKIHIKGYKSIHNLDLALHDLNVLIGANGSGKSNFISVFKLLRLLVEQRLQNHVRRSGGAEQLLHYGSRETTTMTVQLDFLPNLYKIALVPSQNDSLFIEKEEIAVWNTAHNVPLWTRLTTNQIESELEKAASKYPTSEYLDVYNFMNAWRVYHFHDTSDTAAVKKSGKINDNLFLREDAANLAAFLLRIKTEHLKHYERIVKTIQLVIPTFKDFLLRPDILNPEMIRLEWTAQKTDYPFTVSDLSDGSLRFICLACMLLQPNRPNLILLDEPELGLHPSALSILAGLLRKAAHFSQLIIATQSPDLVSLFEAEDIIVVENKNNTSEFNRLDTTQLAYWLEDYSLGEIWDKNIIGGRP